MGVWRSWGPPVNAAAAIDLVAQAEPDVALIDIRLPPPLTCRNSRRAGARSCTSDGRGPHGRSDRRRDHHLGRDPFAPTCATSSASCRPAIGCTRSPSRSSAARSRWTRPTTGSSAAVARLRGDRHARLTPPTRCGSSCTICARRGRRGGLRGTAGEADRRPQPGADRRLRGRTSPRAPGRCATSWTRRNSARVPCLT